MVKIGTFNVSQTHQFTPTMVLETQGLFYGLKQTSPVEQPTGRPNVTTVSPSGTLTTGQSATFSGWTDGRWKGTSKLTKLARGHTLKVGLDYSYVTGERFNEQQVPIFNDRRPVNGDGWRGRWSRWWTALLRRLRGESVEQRVRVEFYERFLRLLRSAGLEPQPAQTAREFVLASQPTWSQRLSEQQLTNVPTDIVTRFYRVRFGGESLPPDELRQLETQLRQLEQVWYRHHD